MRCDAAKETSEKKRKLGCLLFVFAIFTVAIFAIFLFFKKHVE
jgi:hypothetical protein